MFLEGEGDAPGDADEVFLFEALGGSLLPIGKDKSGADPADGADGGTQIGKRYVDADETLELLCTKPGKGSLAVGGAAMSIKGAKPLPSSD